MSMSDKDTAPEKKNQEKDIKLKPIQQEAKGRAVPNYYSSGNNAKDAFKFRKNTGYVDTARAKTYVRTKPPVDGPVFD